MTALQAEKPGYGGAEQKGPSSQNGGETKRSEAGSGEVEESRHGEGIVANAAMGEEIADVGDEGFVAGDPEAIDKSERDGAAEDGKGGVGGSDRTACGAVFGVDGFGSGESGGHEDQEREGGGEGVVFLIGREREEDENESGEEGQEQSGALGKCGDSEESFGCLGDALAPSQRLDEEENNCNKYSEEAWDVCGLSKSQTDDDDGEGLPVEDLIFGKRVGRIVTLEGVPRLQNEGAAEQRPGKEPDEMEAPKEGAGEFVVVHRVGAPKEAEKVLVDEVEPEEAVAVHATGVAEAGENVPGSGDCEEK